MARGQAQAADKQLGTSNAIGSQELQGANSLIGQLTPKYTSLMDTGYFSPAQENAAVTSEMGSATAPFKSAEFQAANNASATRNPSNLAAQQDQLALEEGRTAGEAAANLQNQKMKNELGGAYGLGNLSQEQMDMAKSMYGLGPSTLQARAAGNPSPLWGLAGSLIGAGGTLGAAAMPK